MNGDGICTDVRSAMAIFQIAVSKEFAVTAAPFNESTTRPNESPDPARLWGVIRSPTGDHRRLPNGCKAETPVEVPTPAMLSKRIKDGMPAVVALSGRERYEKRA